MVLKVTIESDVILNIDPSHSTVPVLWPMELHAKDIYRIISNDPCDIPKIIFPLDENHTRFLKIIPD